MSKTLFRPVGQAELDLIRESGWKAFPPRLPHQPIGYGIWALESLETGELVGRAGLLCPVILRAGGSS